MKTYFLTIIYFASIVLTAQTKIKDTLFFSTDNYYTSSPAVELKFSNESYYKKLALEKMRIKQTNTDGYIFYSGDSVSEKKIKPKNILSIKEFVENKKFYNDGTYNKIVDKWKLKDSLTDKYVIYFVDGNELTESKNLEYISYYPIKKETKVIENRRKDTLFFKLDNKYIFETQPVSNPKKYSLKDSGKSKTGSFFFEEFEVQTRPRFKTKKAIDLENFVHSTRFYNIESQIIEDFNLANYFSNYVVFLDKQVEDKHDYIQIKSFATIE